MGVGLAWKHLFVALSLALVFSGLAHAEGGIHPCTCPDKLTCGEECKSSSDCCSGICQLQPSDPGEPDVSICASCISPGSSGCSLNIDCCAGAQCKDGACTSCTCETKTACGYPCTGDERCCSGICSGSSCVSCIQAGKPCPAGHTGDCCPGLGCNSGTCKIASPCANTETSWHEGIYAWAGLAVIMAASFIGLAYMASRLFGLAVLEAWVKIELGELVKSMVLAVLCIGLIATANGASQFLSGSASSANVVCEAQWFMEKNLYADAQLFYMKLAEVYFNVIKVASYSYSAGTSIGGYFSISYSSSPASGLSPLAGEIGQALDAVANYMLLAAAQAAFLQFFGTASVVMLPLGIFLRSFSFTRRLGGTLLAATIASAVIYPASVMLAGEVYKTFSNDLKGLDAGGNGDPFASVKVKDAGNPPLSSVVCSSTMKMFVQSPIPLVGGETGWWLVVCIPLCTIIAAASGPGFAATFASCFGFSCKQIIGLVFTLIKALFPFIIFASVFLTMETGTTTGKLMDDYYVPVRDHVLPAVAKFTVLSLAVFLIPIIITLSLLRNLALSFGGETQLYGLSKMI